MACLLLNQVGKAKRENIKSTLQPLFSKKLLVTARRKSRATNVSPAIPARIDLCFFVVTGDEVSSKGDMRIEDRESGSYQVHV